MNLKTPGAVVALGVAAVFATACERPPSPAQHSRSTGDGRIEGPEDDLVATNVVEVVCQDPEWYVRWVRAGSVEHAIREGSYVQRDPDCLVREGTGFQRELENLCLYGKKTDREFEDAVMEAMRRWLARCDSETVQVE